MHKWSDDKFKIKDIKDKFGFKGQMLTTDKNGKVLPAISFEVADRYWFDYIKANPGKNFKGFGDLEERPFPGKEPYTVRVIRELTAHDEATADDSIPY